MIKRALIWNQKKLKAQNIVEYCKIERKKTQKFRKVRAKVEKGIKEGREGKLNCRRLRLIFSFAPRPVPFIFLQFS